MPHHRAGADGRDGASAAPVLRAVLPPIVLPTVRACVPALSDRNRPWLAAARAPIDAASPRVTRRIIRRRKPADTSNIGRLFAYFRPASACPLAKQTLELAPRDPAFFCAPLSRAIQKRRFLTQAGITRPGSGRRLRERA